MRRAAAAALACIVLTSACVPASPSAGSGSPVADESGPTTPSVDAPSLPHRPEVARLLTEDVGGLRPVDGHTFVNPGAVVRDGGRWWALVNSFTAFPGPSRTDLFRSDDLVRWERVGSEPALTNADAGLPDESVFAMSAVQDDDGTWVAFLHVFAGARQPAGILRATAPRLDGRWTVDPTPVLDPGPEGAWDGGRLAEPEVVRTPDGQWLLWYSGRDDDGRAAIGLATSVDGRSWERVPEPVLTGSQGWSRGSVDGPQVVLTDAGFVMAHAAAERGAAAIGLAFSEDGRHWQPWAGNPVVTRADLPEGAGLFQNALVADGDGVVLLQESGSGSRETVVHALRIDVAAAQAADLSGIQAQATVEGDRATVSVAVAGLDLRFDPDDLTSAHAHVYVDLPPPPAGAGIPLGRDRIVHARGSTVVVDDLAPGRHELWVVLADGQDHALDLPPAVLVPVVVDP